MTDAIALTQSAAARLEFSGRDQAVLACTALASQGDAGLEFSIQGPPGCTWSEQPSPQGERLLATGGHWTTGVIGKEPPDLLRGSRLEVSALSPAGHATDVRLTIGGKAVA